MDVRLSAEQQLLAETVRSVATELGPSSARDLETLDAEAGWAKLCELGLPGLRLPESVGGGGALVADAMVVVEELARGLVPVPFLGPMLGTELLALAGAPSSILSDVAAGALRYTIALDPSLLRLAHIGEAGAVAWDSDGAAGALALDEDERLCVVGLGERLECADQTRTVHLTAPGVIIESGRFQAPLSRAACSKWTATALALLAADLLGAMDSAVKGAVAYSRERIQFGQPIGAFQAVQHLCADAHVATEALRSGVWHAAWAADGLRPDQALAAARVTKAYGAEVAVRVAESAIQVHGGIAITWETLPHLFLRRCLLTRRVLGDEDHHYRELASAGKVATA